MERGGGARRSITARESSRQRPLTPTREFPETQYREFTGGDGTVHGGTHAGDSSLRRVGDGTTILVLLGGDFLRDARLFIEDSVHPQNLRRSYRTSTIMIYNRKFRRLKNGLYRTSTNMAIQKVKEWSVRIKGISLDEKN
ncbi:hypothetical protein M8C21_028212, partial [Ambrosia artemisiifolia]